MPHRPNTIEGIAATISTRSEIIWEILLGKYSEIKSATKILTGAAIKTAIKEVIRVPKINGSAPNWFSTGFQSLLKINFIPFCVMEGQAALNKMKMIKISNPMTIKEIILRA